jgi:hypothetical protein
MGYHSELDIQQQNEELDNCACVHCHLKGIQICGLLINFDLLNNGNIIVISFNENKCCRYKLEHLLRLAIEENKDKIEDKVVSKQSKDGMVYYRIEYLKIKKINENKYNYVLNICYHNDC